MTLPTSTIINLFTSDVTEDQQLVKLYINEFLLSQKRMGDIFDDLTINELAICGFGSKYPINYGRVRRFIHTLLKDIEQENCDLVSTGLALIYDEGKELKKKCEDVHTSYRSGGAYLFSVKMLGLLLLTKDEEFRQFLRFKTDVEGEKYYVPFNLGNKKTRPGKYIAQKVAIEVQ